MVRPRKSDQEPPPKRALKARTKRQPRFRTDQLSTGTKPTSVVAIQETITDRQRLPRGDCKSDGSEKLGSGGLIEKNLRALEVVLELQDVKDTICPFDQYWLRSTAQRAKQPTNLDGTSDQTTHSTPHRKTTGNVIDGPAQDREDKNNCELNAYASRYARSEDGTPHGSNTSRERHLSQLQLGDGGMLAVSTPTCQDNFMKRTQSK